MISFGPIPSRRLGRSLGINNIPPKICTYACVYCQLGRTLKMQRRRQAFYEPAQIFDDVKRKVDSVRAAGESIDFLTFVPDGEPTLDINLGRSIDLLRSLEIPIAVITNSSLVSEVGVRDELRRADWVSVKVDAVWEDAWHRIDRPHGALSLAAIKDGLRAFAATYEGTLVTETMLVTGVNDGPDHARDLVDFLAELSPSVAYLSVPTRPPAEEWARSPDEEAINHFYQVIADRLPRVELLTGYEGNAFASSGDAQADILSITAVHPMRQDAVDGLLARDGADWSTVQKLVAEDLLIETEYRGWKYYVRRLGA